MGEVCRARDTKLNREVAIKVLPAAFAPDAERVSRFRREAQVLASLNHPNIAAIHGLEESEGVLALALELVEGEDLAERLRRGAIPVDDRCHREADRRRPRGRTQALNLRDSATAGLPPEIRSLLNARSGAAPPSLVAAPPR